jgi:hypothetical protein
MSKPPGHEGPPPSPYAAPLQAPPAKSSAAPIIVILLVVFGALVLIGVVCGGGLIALMLPAVSAARNAARRVEHKNQLIEVGVSYLSYWDMQGNAAGPQSWDDLNKVGILDEETISRLQESGTTVVWGVSRNAVDNSSIPPRQIILAYPRGPSPADEEVAVLTADGATQDIPFREIERRLSAWQAEQAQ